MRRLLLLVSFALLLLSPGGMTHRLCWAQTAPARASQDAATDKSAQVDALMAQYIREGEPGAAILVIQGGKIVHKKGYGLADLEHKTPIGLDTAFDLASVSKQFTGMAVMMLVERGKLSYDDHLSKFFPELPPYAETITVRQLLNHTSGLPDVLSPDFHREGYQPSSRELLSLLATRKDAVYAPGDRFQYNNTGYVLLSLIVGKVSGKPFPQFMKENIFQPLGMNRTLVWDETKPSINNMAIPYERGASSFKSLPYGSDIYIYGAKGVVTTAEDMYKWDQALYTEKLVKRSTLKEAFTPARLNNGKESYYGYGWDIGQDHGLNLFRHDGGYLGFRTVIARYPDQQFTIIILSNVSSVASTSSIARRIARIYLGDQMKLTPTVKVDPEILRSYAGKYRSDAGGPATDIVVDGNGLVARITGQGSHRLEPLSASEFFDEEAENIRLQFNRDEKGNVTGFTFKAGNREETHRKLAVAVVDPKIYDAYAGQYQLGPSFTLKVTNENGHLFIQPGDQMKVELRPESEYRFAAAEGGPNVIFVRTFLKAEKESVIGINAGDQIARRVGLPAPTVIETVKPTGGWSDDFDGQALDAAKWERFTFEGGDGGKVEVEAGRLRMRGARGSRSGIRSKQAFTGDSFTVEATIDRIGAALPEPEQRGLPIGHAILTLLFDGSELNRLEWIMTSEGTFEAWAIVNGQGERLDNRNLGTNILNPTLGIVRRGDEFTFTVNGEEALRKTLKNLRGAFQVMLYGYSSTENNWDSVRVLAETTNKPQQQVR
ncbi:MAG TPA: serine hydrolase [Pyrinomonadaceae bacterium]